jgi:hypothetical protein
MEVQSHSIRHKHSQPHCNSNAGFEHPLLPKTMEFRIWSVLKCPDDLTAYRGHMKGFMEVLELWEITGNGKAALPVAWWCADLWKTFRDSACIVMGDSKRYNSRTCAHCHTEWCCRIGYFRLSCNEWGTKWMEAVENCIIRSFMIRTADQIHVWMIKSRVMRWAGYVACMAQKRSTCRVGMPESKSPLGIPGHI